ncbi:ras GTPase-activating protein 3-like [Sinocyclocheilus grahami]|uniref:ras GTPase-activating protein 3-like n=1 Tax=Sinocyclocheilus grahami TaxID=75366 RepID=UPI0007AD37D7|nr:PREDICTED: ras GTPase-activating protein 3-like [Sinocyclocheilus grahami]
MTHWQPDPSTASWDPAVVVFSLVSHAPFLCLSLSFSSGGECNHGNAVLCPPQGKVHLELRLSEVITDSGVVCHKLATRVLECQDLPIVNGQCDPYAAVSLLGLSRSEAKKTKVKRKTNNPQFDEVFFFEVTKPLSYTKRQFDVEEDDVDKLALNNLKFGDEFLGEVRVPLKVLGQSGVHDAWYFLQPRDNGNKSVKADELGSLRLNMPSESISFITQPVSASAAHILGEVCREKQEAAVPLVRLFLHYGKIVPFLSAIAHAEINRTQDPNTIFRGNSLTSKCIDETMKLAGMHYLRVTLKPIIDEICTDHKPCEIDPVKLKESENLDTNRENLRQYVDRIFNVITSSGVSCPTVMCDIFFSLRESAASRFQVDPDVRYTAVSSFIFLRFFAPAILSPNLFHLRPHHPDPCTSRTLTLISKTIQTLGSLAKSKSANFKESYMAAFYDYFNEQKYADAVKNFLDLISSSARWDQKSIETPIMLKEGSVKLVIKRFDAKGSGRFMIKRAQGRNRFGLKNFKKRWFRLTNHEFTYHKTKGNAKGLCHTLTTGVDKLLVKHFTLSTCGLKPVLCELPLMHMMWHDQGFRRFVSVFVSFRGLPANIQLDVDGDRETERIYSLYSTYMSKLVKMQEACGSKSVYDGPEQEEYSTFVIDDPQETYKTLRLVISAVQTLEQQHMQYKRDKFRKTKYGSQEHPIGDQSFQCYIRQQSESSTYSI